MLCLDKNKALKMQEKTRCVNKAPVKYLTREVTSREETYDAGRDGRAAKLRALPGRDQWQRGQHLQNTGAFPRHVLGFHSHDFMI